MSKLVYVTFAETGERRIVERTCNRCYGRGVAVSELETIEVVSRFGTAHKGGEYGETNCGIDATHKTWWWKE